jgi:hypothetical protein
MATGLVRIFSEYRYSAHFCMYVLFHRTTAGLVTINKRAALPIYCESHSQYQEVKHQSVTGKRLWALFFMSVSLCQFQPAQSLLVSEKCFSEFLCMEVSIPHSTTGRVPSSKRHSLMSKLHVRFIKQGTNYQLRGALVRALLHERLILKTTTVQVPICYREPILSIVLLEKHVPNSHNRLVAISYRAAILNNLVYVRKIKRTKTVLVPVRYRIPLLNNLPRLSLISTSHNRLVHISYWALLYM